MPGSRSVIDFLTDDTTFTLKYRRVHTSMILKEKEK